MRRLAIGCLFLGLAGPTMAADTWETVIPPVPAARPAALTLGPPQICQLIESSAKRHEMPPAFFARLIWKESRFDIEALSPVGAQGIAQFMPATAKERGLADPWDPHQAIPASASFLSDLKIAFGNWGLAAAAYNGGPHRVASWLAGKRRSLPYETQDYVLSITGKPVDWFRDAQRRHQVKPLKAGANFAKGCEALPMMRTRASPVAASAPWGVQIAAGISRKAARRAFNRTRARLSRVIGGQSPIIVRSRLVSGRRLYSARVGASSRGAARKLCTRIKRAGGSCVVRRN